MTKGKFKGISHTNTLYFIYSLSGVKVYCDILKSCNTMYYETSKLLLDIKLLLSYITNSFIFPYYSFYFSLESEFIYMKGKSVNTCHV